MDIQIIGIYYRVGNVWKFNIQIYIINNNSIMKFKDRNTKGNIAMGKGKKNRQQKVALRLQKEPIDQDQDDEQEQITWKHQQQQRQKEASSDKSEMQPSEHSESSKLDHPSPSQQQQQEQQMQQQQEQNQDLALHHQRDLHEYQQQIGNRGVVYMSRIPPYMTPSVIRKLLDGYNIERIYLLPESEWARKNRVKKGGSKRICFREGWIEFEDKRVARGAAQSLNGQRMVHKKGSFYSEDLWNLKYLPKFKWHHLTEKLAHEERMKKERLRLEMDQERKLQEHYTTQIQKSKTIKGIIKSKESKGKLLESKKGRSFGQMSALKQQEN